jgi:hypothetical protein
MTVEPYGGDYQPVPRELPSERVVVSAPMSFTGAAVRSWKLVVYPHGDGWMTAARAGTITGVLALITVWWAAVLVWYFVFGIYLLPYRIIRHGARRRKVERLRHSELMQAMYRERS